VLESEAVRGGRRSASAHREIRMSTHQAGGQEHLLLMTADQLRCREIFFDASRGTVPFGLGIGVISVHENDILSDVCLRLSETHYIP